MKTTVTLDGIKLEVEFDYCDAEPENGAPEQYDITSVRSKDDFGALLWRDNNMKRIEAELVKQKGDNL